MSRIQLLFLVIFAVGTSYVEVKAPVSFAADRPLYTSIVLLLLCGITIVVCEKLLPIYPMDQKTQYVAIPLQERTGRISTGSSPWSHDSSTAPNTFQLTRQMKRILFLALIVLVSLRVEVGRRVRNGAHCAGRSYEAFVPAALALGDFWLARRHEKHEDNNSDIGGTTYDSFFRSIRHSRYRFIVANSILALCGILLFSPEALRSTFICSPLDPAKRWIPIFQAFMVILDMVIFNIQSLFLDKGLHGQPLAGSDGPLVIGIAFIASGILLLPVGLIGLTFARSAVTRSLYVSSIFPLAITVCAIAAVALRVVRSYGVMTASVLATFINLYTFSWSVAWNNRQPYPPLPENTLFFVTLVMILAFGAYLSGQFRTVNPSMSLGDRSRGIRSWIPLSMALFAAFRSVPWLSRQNSTSFHPINLLIHDAQAEHQGYLKQAASIKTLPEAAKEYYRRYSRLPPPGFDVWFQYATNRSSLIIDAYDNINSDLLPFWALSPSEVRNRVWEEISQPELMLGGISIRNGRAEIAGDVVPTHRWSLEGVITMIEQFSRHLPDMDLAFNLNDEPRVAVPYADIQELREKAYEPIRHRTKQVWDPNVQFISNFSSDRAKDWASANMKPARPSRFHEGSLRQSFFHWGSVGCPPESRAHTERYWNPHTLCVDCSAPHRLGAWVSNWTLAGDICHQPDLANLHGFYISPAALAATHDLMPVFSQSKAFGFNDIVFPSPWNYVDKVKYDPTEEHPDKEFEAKQNTLFWRGQTSEGVSRHGSWKGMVRQRLVDVSTNTSHYQPLLLPHPLGSTAGTEGSSSERTTLRYHPVSPTDLHKLLKTDVRFVPDIVRCHDSDCTIQAQHFGFSSWTDFQEHWNYAYLYDGDGAGFSGRFIPFLLSRSLPFKSALFREWWEGRLTPWLHFVPIDLRLNELWATFAYFAGFEGEIDGKMVKAQRRVQEGKLIAEQGREWAGKVLRKEDMEIYFFRLLLEWGRLTDDKRDELGFVA